MVHCPFCNEWIKEDALSCPLCYREFDAEHIKMMKKAETESIRKEEEGDWQIRTKYYNKYVNFQMACYGINILMVIAFWIIFKKNGNYSEPC